MIATAPRYRLADPVTPPPRQVQRCSRCKSEHHNARTCPERYATILPAPVAVPVVSERARLLALALELRAGLVALADAQPTWERRWPLVQAANVAAFVVKRLEGLG